jgi:signal transduction histidine kinase
LVVVGAFANAYPYSFQSVPDGPVEGFAVELLDALAREMNFKIRRVALPNEEVKEQFRAGKFDMLQMLNDTEDRHAWADFSVPFVYTQNALFARKGKDQPKSFAEMHGRRIAVSGTSIVVVMFLRAHDQSVEIIHADSTEHALHLVEAGKADGAMVSRITALSVIEAQKLKNVVELHDITAYKEVRHAFAVQKGDSLLLAKLNEGLAALHRSGEYQRIYRKWLGRYEPARFTREQVFGYVAIALAMALLVAVWAGLRQRTLRHRIAAQASDIIEQSELLAALYDNVPLGMCVLDLSPQGARLRSLNRRAREFLGLIAEDSMGRVVGELNLTPEWTHLFHDVLAGAAKVKGIVIEPKVLVDTHRHLMVTRVPLAPHSGGIPRICLLFEDITERWRQDQEIAQGRKLRAIGELVGGIAHEFNNLMTPVMLMVSEVRLTHSADQVLQSDMAVIGGAIQRAADLTARLLTFGRKSESRGVEPLQLGTVVKGAIDLLRPTFDRRILWDNTVPADLPPVLFNPTDLNQVLLNLLLNARDTLSEKLAGQNASNWKPCIRIEAEELPQGAFAKPVAFPSHVLCGWLKLTVADNGMGIAAEVKERIFEPFYTTKSMGQGTGLGLATVWHTITVAGGRIDIVSTVGEGSSFEVVLPVWASSPVQKGEEKQPARVAGGTADVLLIDDDKVVADVMAAVLRKKGYRVRCIRDGLLAWEHLQANIATHDLLVVDINMPGLDGIELARRARNAGYVGHIMIVSGRLTSEDTGQFAGVRVDAVLVKPFNNDELMRAVTTCLGR